MEIRATTRGDQFPVVQRTCRTQLGGIVMRIPEDIPDFQRQWLQQLGGNQIVGLLAMVNSAAKGIRTLPTTTARGSFQLYHQPCYPDLLPVASGSIEEYRKNKGHPSNSS